MMVLNTSDEISTSDDNFSRIDFPYMVGVFVKVFMITFTVSGYTLILWSVNREKSTMTTSAAKNKSHTTIVLQALPIAIYSILLIFIDLFMILMSIISTNDNFWWPLFIVFYFIFIFLSGYVVPASFIIGSPKKRKIFTSFRFRSRSESDNIWEIPSRKMTLPNPRGNFHLFNLYWAMEHLKSLMAVLEAVVDQERLALLATVVDEFRAFR
ncbi:unnamed protein product [Caenorhabditis auriculariae]|uniref:Uncharacterized protein n=1 Tax=Caenorhabditis auriculariae TaxID=2777116 RepID=A0A8S1H3V9_9PELO|nr:unnamed protein product [Caenorhabditis auriculariae]